MVSDWGVELTFWSMLVLLLEYLLTLGLFGMIPALIARSRDPYQSFIFWWIYGMALFIIAVPHAMLFRPGSKSLRRFQGLLAGPRTKKCPFCAEIVMAEARICKYCCRDTISDLCAECRRPLPPGSSRCPHCHVRVTTAGTVRGVAVGESVRWRTRWP